MRQQGFTLIEVLVALAIAAVALTALLGRLGASTELQRKLQAQALAVDEASNLLAMDMLKGTVSGSEQRGARQEGGHRIRWRMWSEKTQSGQLVRRNVAVRVDQEGAFELFLYRRRP